MVSAKGQSELEAWPRACFSTLEQVQLPHSHLYSTSKASGKACPPSSSSGFPVRACTRPHHGGQAGAHTLALHRGNVSCSDTATMDTSTNKQQLSVWSFLAILKPCIREHTRETSSHSF